MGCRISRNISSKTVAIRGCIWTILSRRSPGVFMVYEDDRNELSRTKELASSQRSLKESAADDVWKSAASRQGNASVDKGELREDGEGRARYSVKRKHAKVDTGDDACDVDLSAAFIALIFENTGNPDAGL